MEILTWIDKSLPEIRDSLIFGKYFDTILLEKGTGVYFLFNPNCGIDIILRENLLVESIHLYSGCQKEVNAYFDELPMGLMFSFSQDRVRGILGTPQSTGGGEDSVLYDKTPQWDKYIFESFGLHLQFSNDLIAIELITIESLAGDASK